MPFRMVPSSALGVYGIAGYAKRGHDKETKQKVEPAARFRKLSLSCQASTALYCSNRSHTHPVSKTASENLQESIREYAYVYSLQ